MYLSTARRRLHVNGDWVAWISHSLVLPSSSSLPVFFSPSPSLNLGVRGLCLPCFLYQIFFLLSIIYSFSLSLKKTKKKGKKLKELTRGRVTDALAENSRDARIKLKLWLNLTWVRDRQFLLKLLLCPFFQSTWPAACKDLILIIFGSSVILYMVVCWLFD